MTSLSHMTNDNQEVGEILLKVQDELRNLRVKLAKDGTKIDLKAFQGSLEKVENDIKIRSDQYINHINNQVQTFPPPDEEELPTVKYGVPLENIWDLAIEKPKAKKKQSISVSDFQMQSRGVAIMKPIEFQQNTQANTTVAVTSYVPPDTTSIIVSADAHVVEEVSQINQNQKPPISRPLALTGPSPGQQLKMSRLNRALINPYNPRNREILNENFNIQLPLIEQRKEYKMKTHLITGTTVEHLATLPLAYRRNPTLIPPPINDDEAKYGLMSLLERGLIPANAKITFDPLPIAAKTMSIADNKSNAIVKFQKEDINLPKDSVYKLDPNYNAKDEPRSTPPNSKKSDKNRINLKQSPQSLSVANMPDEIPDSEKQLILAQPMPPPVTPNARDQLKRQHRFVIQNGYVRAEMPEFLSFKQFYCLHWGNIVSILKMLEELCQNYIINVGFINGHKVAELSNLLSIDKKPTLDELIDTFINKDDVEKLVKSPGRKFLGPNGAHLAATKIQSTWRCHRDRSAYLKYRKRKWAAGVIALSWLTHVKMTKARGELKRKRIKQLENFRKRAKDLSRVWPKLKTSKRIIIHIPSLGYNLGIRDNMRDLPIRENYQMSRLCDMLDDNVDVIYVSPVPITEETLQYYLKLFGLKSAVVSGNPEDQTDYSNRYKIVIPEALNSFPTHNMALSTILKYSPKAIDRIKKLIKGRDAYIVPGVMNHDDLHISEVLNVPILGSEPEISYLYSTKSGSKRIFQSAGISIPYGEFDIYNKHQMHECLAQLITENLDVHRWLFKVDDECDGRGIAYLDIAKHLTCYNWALKEAARYGAKWSKKWAQESAYLKILSEIPDMLSNHGKPVNSKLYPTWEAYEKAFLSQGGVLEAHPPSDNVTAITVSMVIEPDSTVKILASGDHIHAESQYSCWGLTYPQSSIDPTQLNEACFKIADVCKQRNIFGYFDIDFVTFIDIKTDKQILWAVDLNISYSDHLAMDNLIKYMTNGNFDPKNHSLEVEPPKDFNKSKKNKKQEEFNKQRYAVMSTRLIHSNLSVIHYSVFFQTCRAHGIGFDVKEKQGTLFTLIDSLNHSHLGMITIGENLQATLQQYAHNLSAIHQEISSANMQGHTNFLMAIQDIENILGITNENSDEKEKGKEKQ